jgi:hypothetical protein
MVYQYRPQWVTENGGAGFSVFHAVTGLSAFSQQAWVDSIQDLFDTVDTFLPQGTGVSFPAEVLNINTANGELVGVNTITPPPSVAGQATGAYSAPTGARIRWATNGIVAGRRVAGTTFLVPLSGTSYDDAGTLATTVVTTTTTAANTYLAAVLGAPVVYSRPFVPEEGDDRPPRVGTEHPISAATVPDKATVLRSRRD